MSFPFSSKTNPFFAKDELFMQRTTITAPIAEEGFPSWFLSTCPFDYQHEYFKNCGFYGHLAEPVWPVLAFPDCLPAWFILSRKKCPKICFFFSHTEGLSHARKAKKGWAGREFYLSPGDPFREPVMDKAQHCWAVMTWYDDCLHVRTTMFHGKCDNQKWVEFHRWQAKQFFDNENHIKWHHMSQCPFSVKVTRNGLLNYGPKQMSSSNIPGFSQLSSHWCSLDVATLSFIILVYIIAIAFLRGYFVSVNRQTGFVDDYFAEKSSSWLQRGSFYEQSERIAQGDTKSNIKGEPEKSGLASFEFRLSIGSWEKNALRLASKYLAFLYFSYATLTT